MGGKDVCKKCEFAYRHRDNVHLFSFQTGFLAACPYLFKAILGPVGGVTADMLIRYKICKIGTVRKTFYGAGNIYICVSVRK